MLFSPDNFKASKNFLSRAFITANIYDEIKRDPSVRMNGKTTKKILCINTYSMIYGHRSSYLLISTFSLNYNLSNILSWNFTKEDIMKVF